MQYLINLDVITFMQYFLYMPNIKFYICEYTFLIIFYCFVACIKSILKKDIQDYTISCNIFYTCTILNFTYVEYTFHIIFF